MKQRLIKLTGPDNGQPGYAQKNNPFTGLNDWDAGLLAIQTIGEQFPAMTWNDFRPENWGLTKKLIRKERREARKAKLKGPDCQGCRMGGKCTILNPLACVVNLASDVKDTVGDVANWVGDKMGDAVRLVTDKEVIDGATRIATAVATKGASTTLDGIFSSIGSKAKTTTASTTFGGFEDVPQSVWMIGGSAVVLLILVVAMMNIKPAKKKE